jgi:hypothetical protein
LFVRCSRSTRAAVVLLFLGDRKALELGTELSRLLLGVYTASLEAADADAMHRRRRRHEVHARRERAVEVDRSSATPGHVDERERGID